MCVCKSFIIQAMDAPKNKNAILKSNVHIGGDGRIGDNNTTYNNYFQGQTVTIPRLLTNNIPVNAEHIIGRAPELELISKYLAENKPTVLVNGIGGIGKTSVATKYVVEYGRNYKHIAWLTVPSDLVSAFTNDFNLLKSLHIEEDVKKLIEGKQSDTAFKFVLQKLNCLESTLVVLDNANDLGDLLQHKSLFDSAHCRYLITSRTQPQDWTIVLIEHLPSDEAVKLFKNIAKYIQASDDDIKNLLAQLFYHTLLIELVAKSAHASGISFDTLQKIISEKFIHDTILNKRKVETGKHGDSLGINAKRATVENYIWLIFENIADISDPAKEILKIAAVTSLGFFNEYLMERCVNYPSIEIDVCNNLDILVERGWLESGRIDEKPVYKMHPLIANVVINLFEVKFETFE